MRPQVDLNQHHRAAARNGCKAHPQHRVYTALGVVPNGKWRMWIDGHFCCDATSTVFRHAPAARCSYQANNMLPRRDLGVRRLWLNSSHSRKTVATINKVCVCTGPMFGIDCACPM
jgi:hypothetical protein